jgi:hypothetical protein
MEWPGFLSKSESVDKDFRDKTAIIVLLEVPVVRYLACKGLKEVTFQGRLPFWHDWFGEGGGRGEGVVVG